MQPPNALPYYLDTVVRTDSSRRTRDCLHAVIRTVRSSLPTKTSLHRSRPVTSMQDIREPGASQRPSDTISQNPTSAMAIKVTLQNSDPNQTKLKRMTCARITSRLEDRQLPSSNQLQVWLSAQVQLSSDNKPVRNSTRRKSPNCVEAIGSQASHSRSHSITY